MHQQQHHEQLRVFLFNSLPLPKTIEDTLIKDVDLELRQAVRKRMGHHLVCLLLELPHHCQTSQGHSGKLCLHLEYS